MTEKKGKRWFACPADIFDQELLSDVYCKRAAWLWLVANAAWKDHTVMTRAGPIEIKRGQVLAGRKKLAETWGWSEKKVRTFGARLRAAGCIKKGPTKGQYADVITICKYEEYQSVPEKRASERANEGPAKGPTKGPHSTKEYNLTQNTKEESTCAFAHFWDAFPDGRKRGRGDAERRFERIIAKGDATSQELIDAVKAGNGIDPEYPPMPATWLNQSRWLDEPQGKKAISAKKQRSAQAKPEPAWMTIQRENGRRHARAMGVPEHEII